MILFGWNNYNLKTVEPHELGMISKEIPDVQIQYRQKYFHLFFIPVFPLGRFWAIRKQGQMYHPPAELMQALSSIDVKTKNTLWAWTGIFIAIGAAVIFNVSEKIDSAAYASRMKENKTTLSTFFKDSKNTAAFASKLRSVNYLMDSSVNDEAYEKKKIDTSTGGILQLYFDAKSSQKDSLVGFDQNNTLIFSCLNHVKIKGELPGDEIRKALSDGEWNGYSDTSAVFSALRKLGNYKYLMVLKEYNRLHPDVQTAGFSSGLSLVQGAIYNIETKATLHTFKLMAANSDSVSHYTFGRKGESRSVPRSQWGSVLENDLNANVLKEAYEYVFNLQKKQGIGSVTRL